MRPRVVLTGAVHGWATLELARVELVVDYLARQSTADEGDVGAEVAANAHALRYNRGPSLSAYPLLPSSSARSATIGCG
jgi:hypothetical protein